jgi:hypothetical protein
MHGIVLLQGLKSAELPESLRPLLERQYRHFLGGTHGTVDICRLRLDRSMAPAVAFTLSSLLLPRRYYARLNDESEMYIAYPTAVVHIRRSDTRTVSLAQSIGALYEIDIEHMRFGEMFELDHPEMHSDKIFGNEPGSSA